MQKKSLHLHASPLILSLGLLFVIIFVLLLGMVQLEMMQNTTNNFPQSGNLNKAGQSLGTESNDEISTQLKQLDDKLNSLSQSLKDSGSSLNDSPVYQGE